MSVRRATTDDLDQLAPLFDAYRRFYQQPGDQPAARGFLADRLEADESVVFIALDEDGCGQGFTQLYPLFSSVRLGRVWLLNDLFVAETARRRGIADALMGAAEDFARLDGAIGLQLETGEDNLAGQALYERRGWVREQGYFHYALALPEGTR